MPGFRLVVKRTQMMHGVMHRHVYLMAEDERVCGILILRPDDWGRLRLIAEAVGIEVQDDIPAEAPQTPTAE